MAIEVNEMEINDGVSGFTFVDDEDFAFDSALIDALADSDNPVVRGMAAESPDTSPDVLERLAHDEDPAVRAAVANEPVSDDIDNISIEDSHIELSGNTFEIDEDIPEEIDRAINGELIDALADSEDPIVRAMAAESPDALPETLEKLANDDNPDVRDAVESNPNFDLEDKMDFADALSAEIDNFDEDLDSLLESEFDADEFDADINDIDIDDMDDTDKIEADEDDFNDNVDDDDDFGDRIE